MALDETMRYLLEDALTIIEELGLDWDDEEVTKVDLVIDRIKLALEGEPA